MTKKTIELKVPSIGPGTVCLSGLLFLVLFIGYVGGLASLAVVIMATLVVAAGVGAIVGGVIWWDNR